MTKPTNKPKVETAEIPVEAPIRQKEFTVKKDENGLLTVTFTGIWHRAEIERASRLVLVKAVEHYRREVTLADKGDSEDGN